MGAERGFPGMLDASTACTGDGRIAPRHGMGNSLGIAMIQQSFLMLLHHRIYGFDMLTLGCLALIMTLMSYKDHICLHG